MWRSWEIEGGVKTPHVAAGGAGVDYYASPVFLFEHDQAAEITTSTVVASPSVLATANLDRSIDGMNFTVDGVETAELRADAGGERSNAALQASRDEGATWDIVTTGIDRLATTYAHLTGTSGLFVDALDAGSTDLQLRYIFYSTGGTQVRLRNLVVRFTIFT